jgi:hypothetical protein
MAVTVSKAGKVIVGILDAELRAAGVNMSDPATSIAWSSNLQQVTVSAPAATEPQLLLVPGVVAAHTGIDTDQLALDDIRARWLVSAIHGKTPAQIYTTMQGAIDGWASLAAAKADLRVWLPLLTAALAWTIFKDEQH